MNQMLKIVFNIFYKPYIRKVDVKYSKKRLFNCDTFLHDILYNPYIRPYHMCYFIDFNVGYPCGSRIHAINGGHGCGPSV
jgi:hypothetical protein